MGVRLFIEKIYCSIIKKIKIQNNKKSYEYWLSKGYNNTPDVTFIIQSHNKSLQVIHIVNKLRQWPSAEVVVIDDGSEIKHINALSSSLQGANEFVIRANDLYENVMYDKAIRFANGRYIVLLQDDDDFEDLSWVSEALSYFSKYPQLAILGGNNGSDFVIDEVQKFGLGSILDREEGKPFQFVHHVDRAPMWINKSLFIEKLKHIDFSFAPFQFDDCELCLRAWLNGLLVGWYDARFKSLSAGGMRIWNSSFTQTQCRRNASKLYELYKDKKNEIDILVDKAKNELY
ncbi:glycosyltransferase family 2 protein [Parabacteroides sp.]